jgi:hypothetical protein
MKEIPLPPVFCSSICQNALNDVCMEKCNPARDMSAFEPKKGVSVPDLPPFPLDDFVKAMTGDERKVIMAYYTAKIVDFLQGRSEMNGQISEPPRRRYFKEGTIYQARSAEAYPQTFEESANDGTGSTGTSESQPWANLQNDRER